MSIAVTGWKGRIGSILMDVGYDKLECDVTDEKSVSTKFLSQRPNVIVHLAGKSDLDYCENISNQDEVMQTKFRGSANVFKWAHLIGATVVHLSSDDVFNGRWFGNYKETSKCDPINFYGLAQLGVEGITKVYDNVKTIRTSKLFWYDDASAVNMVKKMNRLGHIKSPTFVWRSYMHINHFVGQIVDYVSRIDEMPKILNLSGSRVVSQYTADRHFASIYGLNANRIVPTHTEQSLLGNTPIPHRAGLSNTLSKSLGFKQYDYKDWYEG